MWRAIWAWPIEIDDKAIKNLAVRLQAAVPRITVVLRQRAARIGEPHRRGPSKA